MRIEPELAHADNGAMFLMLMRMATNDTFLAGQRSVAVARSLDEALPAIFEQAIREAFVREHQGGKSDASAPNAARSLRKLARRQEQRQARKAQRHDELAAWFARAGPADRAAVCDATVALPAAHGDLGPAGSNAPLRLDLTFNGTCALPCSVQLQGHGLRIHVEANHFDRLLDACLLQPEEQRDHSICLS